MPLSRTNINVYTSGDGGGGGFGTGSFVTGSFTPPNNSLLVVALLCNDNNNDIQASFTIAGGGLTWSRLLTAHNNFTCCQLWWAEVGTASSMTITADCGANSVFLYDVHVVAYTGYESTTKFGATATRQTDASGTTYNSTLSGAPSATSEVLAGAYADAGNDPQAGSGYARVFERGTDSETISRSGSTSTAVNFNVNGSTGASSVAAEILAAADVTLTASNFDGSSPVLDAAVLMEALALGDRVLDLGLNVLDTEATHIYITTSRADTYADATTAYLLGFKSFGAGNVCGSPAAGSPGRQVTAAAVIAGSITTTGTASHWAIVDVTNSRFLAAGPLSAMLAVTSGQSFDLTSFDIRMNN